MLRCLDLEMDDEAHRVARGGKEVSLSPTEYNLLHYLLVNQGKVVSKAQILDHVWQYDFGGDGGVVETYIGYLRRKMDNDRAAPDPHDPRRRLHAAGGTVGARCRSAAACSRAWRSSRSCSIGAALVDHRARRAASLVDRVDAQLTSAHIRVGPGGFDGGPAVRSSRTPSTSATVDADRQGDDRPHARTSATPIGRCPKISAKTGARRA